MSDSKEEIEGLISDLKALQRKLIAENERLRHENMRLQTANEYAFGPKGELANKEREIERLRAVEAGVRSDGANRYWEGRWRDEKAENDALLEERAKYRRRCTKIAEHPDAPEIIRQYARGDL